MSDINNKSASPLLPQQGGEQTYPAVTKQQEQDNTEDIELMLSLMTSAAPNANWPNDMRHRINVGLHYLDQSRAKRKASGAAKPILPNGLIERLRIHADNKDNTASARSTMREVLEYVSAPAGLGEAKAVAPEGWKLMPIEPDDAMQSAGAQAVRMDTTVIKKIWTGNAVYRAMVAAAPVAQALSVVAEKDALRYQAIRKLNLSDNPWRPRIGIPLAAGGYQWRYVADETEHDAAIDQRISALQGEKA